MSEVPIPESAQRPSPLPIFSGARVREDGSFVSPAHQKLSDLWLHEAQRREIPGMLRVTPFGLPEEHKKSVVIHPSTNEDRNKLEILRDRFERGVRAWVRDGEPKFGTIDEFRELYIQEEETNPQ